MCVQQEMSQTRGYRRVVAAWDGEVWRMPAAKRVQVRQLPCVKAEVRQKEGSAGGVWWCVCIGGMHVCGYGVKGKGVQEAPKSTRKSVHAPMCV